MGRSIDALAVGKVIGDVVDPFIPAAKISLHFGSKQVANGCDIIPSLAAHRPLLRLLPTTSNYIINATNLYTLVRIHISIKMVVDIPEGCDASEGREVVSYTGPNPATGIHRYVFVAFKQRERGRGGVVEVEAEERRANFNTRQFASKHALALPVAAIYFNSQKEAKTRTCRRR
ncbi:protein MOTHER of FT and TFL1-like [Senna tora]|uniref:Protein MOTHER of FT and TFL1-like n=1 Tax=Senna tora TaxID=362788 RepID=A0A834SMC8_9FABA|nr:protein MOTHER of FT and TFL1-like [Senna tora]